MPAALRPLRKSSYSSYRQLSSASTPNSSISPLCFTDAAAAGTSANSPRGEKPGNRSLLIRWISGAAASVSVGGLCYWSHTLDPDHTGFHFLKKQIWHQSTSVSSAGAAVGDLCRESSLFRKLSLPNYTSKFLVGDSYRRKVFFKYEKRIRLRSPPEKVFEYFASHRAPNGELFMTADDLMRAVVPVFPPSESNLVREGYLTGERNPGELRCSPSEFFMLFDVDNDGLISFKEYIFFVTLLSIPESSFSVAFKMFDIDNSGAIDEGEFKKVMSLMRAHNRQGSVHKDGLRPGLKVNGSVDNGGLLKYFFGNDESKSLQYDNFMQFMRNLQDEILRLEFAHYDYKSRGTILAKDFALSMVSSADLGHLDGLLRRVDTLNNDVHLRNMQITYEEFKDFAELRKKLRPFSLALFSYGKVNGLLTKEDFQRAASQVCGIPLSDNVVDIIFHVFDFDGDGHLSSKEFVRVLHRREKEIAQPCRETGMIGSLFGFLNNRSSNDTFERLVS
ncbi:Calcium uptake protein, mitochondrial [Linum grandiflorum]